MDFAAARVKMVDNQIRTTDVTSHETLRAFLNVPREVFVPEERKALAYIDSEVPLGNGRFLISPSPLAKMIQLAQVGPQDVVLDVGCGTGYSSAVLAHLAGSIVALEEDADLAGRANAAFDALGIVNAAVVTGPLKDGWSGEAPYDVILFEGSVEALPKTHLDQLKDRGRLVVVERSGASGMAKLYTKEDGIVSDRFAFNCHIPALPGFAKPREFVF
ncbi:protein-L-isoaspartate O-methyltransferase [Aureimonas flava]|uniref:Protein-L-isoaspartate O-methyltransferase n=1 Tax=Aureimonas flava TaxID=2320271 RepID=A0A3A1WPU7_9HYPH|nr:protein-L-isoaspartate O-methyltransferase [Aureimonas flava]RIY03420.1 protein-L-isoaspartate O-methyltransferase [Aureimonas flava]